MYVCVFLFLVTTFIHSFMASYLFMNCFLFFLAATTSVQAARQFQVGGHFAWHQPDSNDTDFYTQWAQNNRFQIGDSLVFEYENDSVLTVEKWDYFNCDTSEPITTFTNGKTTLNLDRSGPFYFISGTDDHCNHGQKLLVEVMAPHPTLASPPSVSIPPQSSSPIMAPSPFSFSSDSSDTIDQASSSSIMVLTSSLISTFVTFVIVMLLAL